MVTDLNQLIANLSRADIEKLLATKDEIEALEKHRRDLQKQLAGVDRKISKLVGKATRGAERRGRKATAGRRRKAATGPKVKLEDVVVQVLAQKGQSMPFKEIHETIVSGKLYRSRSKQFDNVLRRTLSGSDKVQRVGRGIYDLAK